VTQGTAFVQLLWGFEGGRVSLPDQNKLLQNVILAHNALITVVLGVDVNPSSHRVQIILYLKQWNLMHNRRCVAPR
jgi:hypothetical protein